jgi:hypothetical protein
VNNLFCFFLGESLNPKKMRNIKINYELRITNLVKKINFKNFSLINDLFFPNKIGKVVVSHHSQKNYNPQI